MSPGGAKKNKKQPFLSMQEEMTFWEHLDVLRGDIMRMMAVTAVFAAVAFCLRDELFKIVLAPSTSDFVTYRLLGTEPFRISLINVGLTEQFMVHMKTALVAGLYMASPYVICALYGFIAPALYKRERHHAVRIVTAAYVMFIVGTLASYFLVFPLTVRFLGTYQVSEAVTNMLSLQSYIDTFLLLSLVFGIVFELPVVSWLLALFGLLRPEWMTRYRRHAIVTIIIVAAVITPTADAFTLFFVSLPIWLLYEASIVVVRLTVKPSRQEPGQPKANGTSA